MAYPADGASYDTSLLPVDGVDDLVNADTTLISDLASNYSQIAEAANQAAGTLRGHSSGVNWTGEAARAFEAKAGSLPKDLDTIHQSYATVASALNTYEPEVYTAQTQVLSVLRQLETAHTNLSNANANLATAKSTLASAQNTQANAPAHQAASTSKSQASAVTQATSGVSSSTTAVSNAQGEIDRLVAQGKRIVDGFTQARGTAAAAFKSAGHHAPQESGWDKFCGAVDDVMGDVGSFAWSVVKGIGHAVVNLGKAAVDLPAATWNVIQHPSSLKAWERFGTDAVAAATIVLLATGAGEGMLGTDAAVEGTEGALGGAEGATSVAGRAQTVLHTVNEFADTNKTFKASFNLVQNVTSYGGQVQGLYDDAKSGDYKGMVRDAALDAGSDVVGSKIDDKLGDATGSTRAEAQLEASEAFAAHAGTSNISALRALEPGQRASLLQAAGVTNGRLSGDLSSDRAFINNLQANRLVHSSVGHVINASTRERAAGVVVDGVKDTANEYATHGANAALGIQGEAG